MPRNDAKRTNENTKRLPFVDKIIENNNNKKRKNNNKIRKNYKRNTITIHQQQQRQQRGEKEFLTNNANGTTESWITINQYSDCGSGGGGGGGGGGDNTTCNASSTKTSKASLKRRRQSDNTTNEFEYPNTKKIKESNRRNSDSGSSSSSIYKNNIITNNRENKISEETTAATATVSSSLIPSELALSAASALALSPALAAASSPASSPAVSAASSPASSSAALSSASAVASTSASSSSSLSLSSFYQENHNCHYRHQQLSTLYPIVIEIDILETQCSLPGDLNNTLTATTTATTTTLSDEISATTSAASSITKHSTSSNVAYCNTKEIPAIQTKTEEATVTTEKAAVAIEKAEVAATATATATTTDTTTLSNVVLTAIAGDTLLLEPHISQPQNFQTNNVPKQRQRRNNRYKHQQGQLHDSHQTEEVKARLATLRKRKVIVANDKTIQQKGQQKQQQQQQKEEILQQHQGQEKNCSDKGNNKDILKREEEASASTKTVYKRAFPQQFDEATLNLIETLSDNEVKKPKKKRKRNQTAALLLGFSTQPVRSKRLAASAAAAALTGDICNNNHQQTTLATKEFRSRHLSLNRDFLKPLPIEKVNTNSKKRPRIMSLYERPFQTTSDGRGGVAGVVSNGYMSTSRSSSSGGGGSGGALIMSDSNDGQELANQYYQAGTSGAGIAGNSSSSAVLLGNGSAINHAPTMGTLCNIGNTCYLNSVVYTLRFAPQFLHNLHHLLADLNALQQNIARARAKSSSLGRGNSAVHMENARSWSSKDLASMEQYTAGGGSGLANATSATCGAVPGGSASSAASSALTQVTQKSSHQLLTEKLHDLYQSLYRNEMSESTEPHHADTLLHAIQDVSSIFEGNQQQDAHEFLMCVLNSIRETSQTLLKAIAECPDVILNGYIANPDDNERDLKHSNLIGSGGGGGNGGGAGGGLVGGGSSNTTSGNMSVSSALSSLTSNSKSSLFFSRKSKRKDETKNSKNTRLQSPLKDNQIPSGGTLSSQSNSLFYLNANDLNSSSASSTSPPSVSGGGGGVGLGSIASPFNSIATTASAAGGSEEIDNSSSLALLLKDKQRLECKIRELGLDFFNEDFEGITVSTTKCLSCETITEQKETMIDIAVPVPQAGYESNNEYTDRPSSFIQNSCITREHFRNENKYRCEQCCGYTEAIRSISYEVLPRLLIIQLSRFSGGMEKINSYIPTSFTLQCFCSKCCELSDANKLHIYKLYSVITHVGATMSVGHYIAYTCSLDLANEYINCPKEQRRRRASQERAAAAAAAANGGSGGNGIALGQHGTAAVGSQASSLSSTNAIGLGSTTTSSSSSSGTTGFMKIMKFGRSKASSSGDMSKNVKHINGLTSSSSKAITNGIGKLTVNNSGGSGTSNQPSQCSATTCQSINCCAMRLTAQQQLHYLHTTSQTNTSDLSESDGMAPASATATGYTSSSNYNNSNYNNNMPQSYVTSSGSGGGGNGGGIGTSSGYGSTGRGATRASYATQNHNGSEPIWYMCDDDKIKPMTQREFEELLSPARKITITPYLLFYARYNLQTTTPPKSSSVATMSSSSPGPMTSSPQASWSNESLQSSGHSAHSSGMRM